MKEYQPKLKVNSIIQVFGWIMMQGLKEGKYRVAKITERNGEVIYWFSLPKGNKIIIGHKATSIDSWILEHDSFNRISIIAA